MTKQKNQETSVSFDTSTLRKWFEASKTNRVVVSKSDGSEMFDVSLLVAIIVTLIIPELVAIGVLALFLTEGKVALIRPEETVNNEVEPVNA
jgi:hypothetical protein